MGLSERAALVDGRLEHGRDPRRRVPPLRLATVARMTERSEGIIQALPILCLIRARSEARTWMSIRVLIVDDDPLLRAGLKLMLGGAPDIRVVGEAGDGGGVQGLIDRLSPDVVLMDIRMPGTDGLTATEAVRRRPGAPEVVILTTFDADEHVLRALRAGAAGFILKDTPPAEIVESVRRVAAGQPVLSPAVTKRLITRVADVRQRPAQEQGDRPPGRI